MLNAALDAAITTVPRLLIADCMTIFAMANTALWIPAGSPIRIMSRNVFPSNLSSCRLTRMTLSVRTSFMKRITELTAFATTVAMATPFTVILSTMTKNRLRSTFSTPDMASATRGIFVSPMLLNIAASKLYRSITGIPRRYILMYISAYGYTSSGTLSTDRRFPMNSSPISITRSPPTTDTMIDVCTALCMHFSSFLPMAFAITTFAPSAIPMNRLSSRPTMGLLAPTAATETVFASPVKFPTIAMSDALNNCSSIPVAATGSAYCMILFHREPFSISILAALVFDFCIAIHPFFYPQ